MHRQQSSDRGTLRRLRRSFPADPAVRLALLPSTSSESTSEEYGGIKYGGLPVNILLHKHFRQRITIVVVDVLDVAVPSLYAAGLVLYSLIVQRHSTDLAW